jgi:hypothetical protein
MRSEQVERHSSGWLRRVAASAAVAAVLVGAGCAKASPAVVAYVGDTEITQRQLDGAIGAVEQTLEQGQQVSTSAVVNVMVAGVLADQIAAAHHLSITDAQRDQLLATSNLVPLLAIPAAKAVAYDAADAQLVSEQVGAQAFQAEVKQRTVRLNPRYGVLDPTQQTIIENSSGSLSTPAAAASQPAG